MVFGAELRKLSGEIYGSMGSELRLISSYTLVLYFALDVLPRQLSIIVE